MIRIFPVFLFMLFCSCFLSAQTFVKEGSGAGDFAVVARAGNAIIYVDPNEDWLVLKAASLLREDIERVTGKKTDLVFSVPRSAVNLILIGTVHGSPFISRLTESKKINADGIKDKWEAFTWQVVSHPLKGIKKALVIVGSDRRGAAYGIFTLSEQIGVSPWYWWADVPVKKKNGLYIDPHFTLTDSPRVKYRGIFINDEAPAFAGWASEKFGGINHTVYERIFELLLRLKANYLWPAMWGNAFNDDDTLNPVLADRWGIVMGTSHHEPMMRSQQEWKRYGQCAWDYTRNDSVLRAFWKNGIEKMGHHESIVTIGMRGDGDMPMTEGTAVQLLDKIVSDQRKIIREVTGKPATETPQLWALYKEVQDYYDKGMRVPDDITLLLCDDNWGNIRRLPRLTDQPRAGGYGIYYHFDYVGDPRNYKWINTNNIARVWEQMHLAYLHQVKKIWIVNVGDLKPMELPISFFLSYAWNPGLIGAENLHDFYIRWSSAQFGSTYAKETGRILEKYAQYISRKKPELLTEDTYSLENFNEAQRVNEEWNSLLKKASKIYSRLPEEYKNAYFQLVLHPVKACANLHNLYLAVGLNHQYAKENNPLANRYASEARRFYRNDSLISAEYNHINGGKWNHMMDQTHIGYTNWQQPVQQTIPFLAQVGDSLPAFQKKLSGKMVPVRKPAASQKKPGGIGANVFYEREGYVSIQAAHYSRKDGAGQAEWKIIPGIGGDGDGITRFPLTGEKGTVVNKAGPSLVYDFYAYDTGSFSVNAFFSPTLNIYNDPGGLQCAIAIDQDEPQIISINKEDHDPKKWSKWVADNVIIQSVWYTLAKKGKHTLRFYSLSPAVILQKIVLDFGGMKKSQLGPPETLFKSDKI